MNHSASGEFLDGDKKLGLDAGHVGAKTLDDWRTGGWTGGGSATAGFVQQQQQFLELALSSTSSAEQYLEHCEQSTGRSQNSPQAVPDYLLRKTDSSLPPAISRNLEQIYGLSEKL